MAKKTPPTQVGQQLTPIPPVIYDTPIAPLTEANRVLDFGVSGLNRAGGYIHEEFLVELRGQRGAQTMREMRENDPTAGAMLFLLEQMIKQVDWTIKPYGDQPDQGDLDDAEFIRQCLFDDQSKTWMETLSEICSMLWAGYAPMEVMYKRRLGLTPPPMMMSNGISVPQSSSCYDDGRWGWAKWSVRAQETIVRWQFDARNEWQAFEQQAAPDFQVRTVPREKVLLFRVKSDRDNPEGRSLLRSAYTSWMKKKKLEIIEGIGIERKLAGFPILTPPEGVDLWNPNDANASAQLADAKNIVKSVRMDEQMGMVLPFGWDFKLVSGDGGRQTTDTNLVIERYDHRMAMTIAMDFIFMGSGSNAGARAQALVDVQLFNTALSGILDSITEVINRQAIPKLFQLNGLSTEYLPKLVHGDAGSPNLTALAQYVTSLAQAGMPLFPDPALEHSLRAFAGLPEPVGGVGKRHSQQESVPPPMSDREEFVEAVKVLRDAVAKLVQEPPCKP